MQQYEVSIDRREYTFKKVHIKGFRMKLQGHIKYILSRAGEAGSPVKPTAAVPTRHGP